MVCDGSEYPIKETHRNQLFTKRSSLQVLLVQPLSYNSRLCKCDSSLQLFCHLSQVAFCCKQMWKAFEHGTVQQHQWICLYSTQEAGEHSGPRDKVLSIPAKSNSGYQWISTSTEPSSPLHLHLLMTVSVAAGTFGWAIKGKYGHAVPEWKDPRDKAMGTLVSYPDRVCSLTQSVSMQPHTSNRPALVLV